MAILTPYLLFDGNCAEAMTFYKECLGGELTLMKAADSPMKAQFPPALQERIINAEFKGDGLQFTASDWFLPEEKPVQGNTVCAYISGVSYPVLERYFNKLSEGASKHSFQPLQSMPFGSYGALTDKFGVRWMFQGDAQNS